MTKDSENSQALHALADLHALAERWDRATRLHAQEGDNAPLAFGACRNELRAVLTLHGQGRAMTLLEAVAIALDELTTICAEDGDETCYEITIGDVAMFSVRVFYEGGEAGATVTMPDLLIPRKDGLTPEDELRSIIRTVRAAAHEAAPW